MQPIENANLSFGRSLHLQRDLQQLSAILPPTKADLTFLYGAEAFAPPSGGFDPIGGRLPVNIRKNISALAEDLRAIDGLSRKALQRQEQISRDILDSDASVQRLKALLYRDKSPILPWWENLVMRKQVSVPLDYVATILWLPTQRPIAEFLKFDLSAIFGWSTGETCEGIALNDRQIHLLDGVPGYQVASKHSSGISKTISALLDIKLSELPVLLLFPTIIDRPVATVDLKGLSGEDIKNGMLQLSSHISRSIRTTFMLDPNFWNTDARDGFHGRIREYFSGRADFPMFSEDDIRGGRADRITFADLLFEITNRFNISDQHA